MNILKVRSDNPRADQWKLLGQFSYPTNISRYSQEHGLTPSKDTVNYIAGCMRQSEAYFNASDSAPLDISPLLLYYGATNLLAGTSAMLTGHKAPIMHHGMYLILPSSTDPRIGDYEVKPVRPTDGALQSFCNVFAGGLVITNGGTWNVKELFGSLPDLLQEFETCYQPDLPLCIPTASVKAEMHGLSYTYDRIETSILLKYPDHYQTLMSIANVDSAYLPPRYNIPSEYVKLYYKRGAADIGIYSIFGQKYLPLTHMKNGQAMCPSPAVLMYMGLYSLGYLSRYYPERWNPFVRTDETGERLLVERFMSVCQRYFPNLVLNEIKKARVQFVYEIETNPIS